MRRDALCVVGLRESRIRQEDELGAADCIADVRRSGGDLHRTLPVGVLQRDHTGGLQGFCVAAPEAHFVTLRAEIRGRGICAVAAADDGYLHSLMPIQPLCEMSNTTPLGSRN